MAGVGKNAPMKLSPIAAGLWRLHQWGLDTQGLVNWIEQALALGITSFDHADIYGDYTVESQFGRALAAEPGLRNRLQIITKCGIKLVSAQRPAHRIKSYDSSRAHVVASVDASLRALRTDRIDLLLLHRPDLLLDPDELADTLRRLLAAGKVLHFGVSNHTPGQLALLDVYKETGLSPAFFPRPKGAPLYAAVGLEESDEFLRHNRLIRDVWGPTAVPVCETVPGANHFTVLGGLVDPAARLHELALRLLGIH